MSAKQHSTTPSPTSAAAPAECLQVRQGPVLLTAVAAPPSGVIPVQEATPDGRLWLAGPKASPAAHTVVGTGAWLVGDRSSGLLYLLVPDRRGARLEHRWLRSVQLPQGFYEVRLQRAYEIAPHDGPTVPHGPSPLVAKPKPAAHPSKARDGARPASAGAEPIEAASGPRPTQEAPSTEPTAPPEEEPTDLWTTIETIERALLGIDVFRPRLDHRRVEAAVAAHLRALDLSVPSMVWASHPRATYRASRSEVLAAQVARDIGWITPTRDSPYRAWAARLGLKRDSRTEAILQSGRALSSPGAAWSARLAALDDHLHTHDLVRGAGRGAAVLSVQLARATRLLCQLQQSPDREALHDPGERRWWPHGYPGRAACAAFVHLAEAAAAGLLSFWNHGHLIVLLARPQVSAERGQLHRVDGQPAVRWEDGSGSYFWRGTRIPASIASKPHELKPRRFLRWRDERRRELAVERYGLARWLREGRARLVHQDRHGKLWRLRTHRVDVQFVELESPAATEGARPRKGLLRVPSHIRTARAAAAWTFGLERSREYRPGLWPRSPRHDEA